MNVENRWLPWVLAAAAVVLVLAVVVYVASPGATPARRGPTGGTTTGPGPTGGAPGDQAPPPPAGGGGGPGAQRGVSGSVRLGEVTKTTGCRLREGLPDPACTPGATDPRVTQQNLHQTICVSGYTRTVRPPVTVTNPIKRERLQAYGETDHPPSDYELDHLVPLELGGHPSDVANLWPEPGFGPLNFREKDDLENAAHEAVCAGRLPLTEAQRRIAQDWEGLYAELLGHRP